MWTNCAKNKFAPCLDISNIFIWTFIYSRYVFATLQNVLVHNSRFFLGSVQMWAASTNHFFCCLVAVNYNFLSYCDKVWRFSDRKSLPKLWFCKIFYFLAQPTGLKAFSVLFIWLKSKFKRIIVYIGMEEGSRKQTFISTDFSSKNTNVYFWQKNFKNSWNPKNRNNIWVDFLILRKSGSLKTGRREPHCP